ncbi:SLBB domain-containing protein [Carboxylicivirga taeanensis]|uniref:SLBB domain-containing protein n=1 Tax=Carboxylicivirga taeanensis TaxID=1416875 RepID=UPI003F6DABBB
MKIRLVLLSLFLTVASLVTTFGQKVDPNSIDPSKVNVDELSDEQIMRLIQEMEKRGLTEDQAIMLAQARGMSSQQVMKLQQRIREVKLSGVPLDPDMGIDPTKSAMAFDMVESVKEPVDSAQIDTRIFGFSFFNNENLSFEPNVNIPVPSSYVIGAGDEILIDVWGMSQQNYMFNVDKNGNITIPNIGPIRLGGLTQDAASKRILNKLSSIYNDLKSSTPQTFASVSIGSVKAIKVNVIGEVFLPGTYTIPGTASAFNALYLSGGPNPNGSFRNIQVIRNGKVHAVLDVYEYLLKGKSSVNIPLREDDVILIPTYEKRIKVGGELKRNGLFEAKDNETVADIIEYAGGFTEEAYTHRLELYRNSSRQKVFKDIFSDQFAATILQSGDSVYVGPILARFKNKVSITGAVYRPGNYELSDNLTLKQLIDKADGIREDAFLNRGMITRLRSDLSLQNITFDVSAVLRGEVNYELQREDMVTISSIESLREVRTVEIFGDVQYPGEFDFQEDMTLSDLVFKAGGFKESASDSYIEVSRRLSHEEAKKASAKIADVYQFNISRDLKMHGEDAAFVLQPFDQVFVRRAPGFENKSVVHVRGEVNYAGQFSLTSKNERISTIIARAGGFTPDAYAAGAMLTRRSAKSEKERKLREQLMKNDKSIELNDIGFDVVGIDLEKIMKNPGSKDDIFLKDGDELIIPRELQTVEVSGAVLNPLSVSFQKGKSLRHYVRTGGGFALRAKKGKVYVIYPNGVAAATKNYVFFNSYPKVLPGTEIVVPKKPEKAPMSAASWIAIASSLASLSLTIVTVINATN